MSKELLTIREVLSNAAIKWPDKTGLIFDVTGDSFTFTEVKEHAEQYANAFKQLGIQSGDKVALMLPNDQHFPLSWLALGLIGAVTVPMNTRYQEVDAAYIIENSESRLVVTTSAYVSMLSNVKKAHQLPIQIVTVDEPTDDADHFLADLLKTVSGEFTAESKTYPDTLMNIQYTSGTTGKPKGCMLTQKYWINIGEKIANPELIGMTENDRLLTSQPFYYMDPQWNTMAALVNGASLVVLEKFSPSKFWKKVSDYGVTFFYVLGNMPLLLLKMPESEYEKNHSVRLVGCSAIPPGLHKQIEERWNVKWLEVFGMTETGYDISMRVEDHDDYVGSGALGKPATDREVRIIGPDGEFLERGQTGEMVFRGKWLMDGYYKNKEATEEVFRNGWFHTGDLAYMDEAGMLYYAGRLKDMIRRSGENIAAAEVEEVIMQHESVKLAACIPVDDEIRGEEVKAYLVLKDTAVDQKQVVQSIVDHCEKRLASFKVPRYWAFKDDLPLTPSERIAKHVLKEETKKENLFFYDTKSENYQHSGSVLK